VAGGYAWLAGGTCYFSTPQIGTDTLIDLEFAALACAASFQRRPRNCGYCTIAELDRFKAPADWAATPLIRLCCIPC